MAPRVKDIGDALRAQVLFPGEAQTRRVKDVAVCATTVPNALKAMKPGTLVITPGDRSDIILAAAMTVQRAPLAGLVPPGGLTPDRRVLDLCRKVFDAGLPLLQVQASSYRAATHVAAMNPTIPVDERRACREDHELRRRPRRPRLGPEAFAKPARVPRLSPPAFRHRLIETAREDVKRIVLPEGSEPRTVAAAAIVAAKDIAKCVLLGNPDEIRDVGGQQGDALSFSSVDRGTPSRWPRGTSMRSWRATRPRG